MQIQMKLEGADSLVDLLERYRDGLEGELVKAFSESCEIWAGEAKRRVPVDTGRLRNGILKEVRRVRGGVEGRVGTNVKYGKYIEFGTPDIAGGRVKALGPRPDVTDTEAIKTWPALEERGGSGQQMPWLRPAFMAIADQIVARIKKALTPPR